MPKVSGRSVLSLQKYVNGTYGGGAFDRLLDRLPQDDAAPMREIILPVNWYEAAPYMRAVEVASEELGDASFPERFGAFAAEFQINAFQKILLRFASPVFFLDRAGRIWQRSHDTGKWHVEGGPKWMRGTLTDFAIVNATYCRVLVAWIHRASQLTGTVGETHHPKCRARGDDACVFEGSWK